MRTTHQILHGDSEQPPILNDAAVSFIIFSPKVSINAMGKSAGVSSELDQVVRTNPSTFYRA
jgi:hypothetical protein